MLYNIYWRLGDLKMEGDIGCIILIECKIATKRLVAGKFYFKIGRYF